MKRKEITRPPDPTEGDVLKYLAEESHPASIREIAHGLDLRHHGRRVLPRIIAKLKRHGDIEEMPGDRYRLSGTRRQSSEAREAQAGVIRKQGRDPNLVSGSIIVHRDGYAFVVPDEPVPGLVGDLFVGRDYVGDAMNGDRVRARIDRRHAEGRAEGRVVQILQREHPTVVGLFRYGSRGNVVLPYDNRLQHEIVIPLGEELTPELQQQLPQVAGSEPARPRRSVRHPQLDGAVVNVELTRYPKGGLAPSGRVIEILGKPGEMGVDVEIIIRKHHLPHEFPDEVLAEAHAVSQLVHDADLRGRRDFRDLPIVTIDGETARDFDDAVHVAERNGGYELEVHIADVAHYVGRGSPLDREARLRGTSVYFPNRAVPMLPEELSNGICSLNPHVDRLVMSVLMEFSASGEMTHAEFMPGVIRSAERMTYTNVYKVLEGDREMTARYEALAPNFKRMKELALILNARRYKRGSIDFDLPEPIIEFDELGRMTSIVRSVRNIAHRIIEEFMLAANEAVAQYLEKRGIASLHRVHEKPDPKKVLEFEEMAKAFGYSLGVADLAERRLPVRHGRAPQRGPNGRSERGRMRQMEIVLPASDEIDIRPQHYQRLTEKIAGKPEERILSYFMLRSLRQARYLAEPLGHFALAADEYTHFTSPIRRYPDLIVHRALKWALDNPSASLADFPMVQPKETRLTSEPKRRQDQVVAKESKASMGPYRIVELEEIAAESSESERRADTAERDLMDWKTAQFMEGHLGEEYEALIISVQKFGFFIELVEIFVEGLVGIDNLEAFTGARCFYREQDHAIVADRRKLTFRVGDRVRVRADRIDPLRRRVEFALVQEPQNLSEKQGEKA